MARASIALSLFLVAKALVGTPSNDPQACLGDACPRIGDWSEGEDQSITMIQRRSAAKNPESAGASTRPHLSSYINGMDSSRSKDGRRMSSNIDHTHPETGQRFKLKYDGVLAAGVNLVNIDDIEEIVRVKCDDTNGMMQIEVGTDEQVQLLMKMLESTDSTSAATVLTGHAGWGCSNEHGESKSIMHYITKVEPGVTPKVIALQTSRAKLEELFENLHVSMVAPAKKKSIALRESSSTSEEFETSTARWSRRRRRRSGSRRRSYSWAARMAAQRAAELAAARRRAEEAAERARQEAEMRAEAAREAAEKRAAEVKEEAEEKAEEEKKAAEAREAALKKKAEEAKEAALKRAEAAKAAALKRAEAIKAAALKREEMLKQRAEAAKEAALKKAQEEKERAEQLKKEAEARAEEKAQEAKQAALERAEAVRARAEQAKQRAIAKVQAEKQKAEAEKEKMVQKADAMKQEAEKDAEEEKQKAQQEAQEAKARANADVQQEKQKAKALKENMILKAETEKNLAIKKADAYKTQAEAKKAEAEAKAQAEKNTVEAEAKQKAEEAKDEAEEMKQEAIQRAAAAESEAEQKKKKAEAMKNNAEQEAKQKVKEEKDKAEAMKQETIQKADAEKEKAIAKADQEKEAAIQKADEEKEAAERKADEAQQKANEEKEKAEMAKTEALEKYQEEKKKAESLPQEAKQKALQEAEEEKNKALKAAQEAKQKAEAEKEKAITEAAAEKKKAEADAEAAEQKAEAKAKAAAERAKNDAENAAKAAKDFASGVVSAAEGKINTNKMIAIPGINSLRWNVDSSNKVLKKSMQFGDEDSSLTCEDCYFYVDAYIHLDINVTKYKLHIMECVLQGNAKANIGIRQPVKVGSAETDKILATIKLADIDFMIGVVPFHISMKLTPTLGADGEINIPNAPTSGTDTFAITAWAGGSIQQGIKVDASGENHINVVDYDYGYKAEGLPPGSNIQTAAYITPVLRISADLIGGPMTLSEKFQIHGEAYAPGGAGSETCPGNTVYFTSDFTRETVLSSAIDIRLGKIKVYQKSWPPVVLDQHQKPLLSGCIKTSVSVNESTKINYAAVAEAAEATLGKIDASKAKAKPQAWDFAIMSNGNLMGVLKGPVTGSGKTEVHMLQAQDDGGKGQYSKWALQVPTGFGISVGGSSAVEFVIRPDNGNLVGIMKGPVTGSGKTEVHILKAPDYKEFALHSTTGFSYTAGQGQSWKFLMKYNGDLAGVLRGPVTGSKKTEVHITSAQSNYQSFVLHAATGMDYSDNIGWDFGMKSNGDIVGILKGPVTGSGKTEVHILKAETNYRTFSLHSPTALGITTGAEVWDFGISPDNGNLVGILRGPVTGSGKTEVHICSANSNYQTFALQSKTSMDLTATKASLLQNSVGTTQTLEGVQPVGVSPISSGTTFQAQLVPPESSLDSCAKMPLVEFSCTVHSEVDPHSAAVQAKIKNGSMDVAFGCSIHRRWEKDVVLPEGVLNVPALSSGKVHPTEFKQMSYIYSDGTLKPRAGAALCTEYKWMDEDAVLEDPCTIHMYTSTGNLPVDVPDMSFKAAFGDEGLVLSEIMGSSCYAMPLTMTRSFR